MKDIPTLITDIFNYNSHICKRVTDVCNYL